MRGSMGLCVVLGSTGWRGVVACGPKAHANCSLGGMSTFCGKMRCLEMFWAKWLGLARICCRELSVALLRDSLWVYVVQCCRRVIGYTMSYVSVAR
jgi:hypothetical protein